jgi:capsid portal protein
MGELRLKVPEELEEKLKELTEWESMLLEFIRLKIFEHELQKSKELQRFVLESLAAKSKLTPEDARELAEKVKAGMLDELNELQMRPGCR